MRAPGTAFALALLGGCALLGRSPFGGAWAPLNRYPPEAARLPLDARYVYFTTPVDGSLRALLARWAGDTGRSLRYTAGFDLTLHRAAATLRETDIQAAITRLNSLYAGRGIAIAAGEEVITVSAVRSGAAGASPLPVDAAGTRAVARPDRPAPRAADGSQP